MSKKKQRKKTRSRNRRGWWRNHWDEVVLWISLILGTFLILKGSGAI